MESHSPTKLQEALGVLADHQDDVTILCGGTDLMVFMELGTEKPKRVLNIWNLQELRGVCEDEDHVIIGATTTYTQIIRSPLVQQYLPTLVESAQMVGARQIQNRGTLGGNLGNASPAADTPPVLLAAGGTVQLMSQSGPREVDLDQFFTGYRQTARRPDELISSVRIHKKQPTHHDWFQKVGTRQAQSISKVVIGARATRDNQGKLLNVRLAAGSVAATTCRLKETEAALTGHIASPDLNDTVVAAVSRDIAPIDDIRSTAEYRLRVTSNLVKRWIRALQATATTQP